jgi:cobalt/nickel transport system permease protein
VRHNFIDRYASLDSPLHSLEARTKIIGFLALTVAVLWVPADRSGIFFGYFFMAAILMGISQIPLGYFIARALVLLPFVLLAALAAPGKGDFNPGVLGVIVLRSTLCLINLLILTGTTPFPELLRGLRRLGFPRVLVLNLSFLYRYLFVLTDEAMRMRQARECRRVGRASVRAEMAILGSMLGTLLLRSFEHAERMYQAMLSRAYIGEFHVLAPREFTWRDFVFLGGVAVTIGTVFRLSS